MASSPKKPTKKTAKKAPAKKAPTKKAPAKKPAARPAPITPARPVSKPGDPITPAINTTAPPFIVRGTNATALFTLTVYRGEGMCLLAMNWKTGTPALNFVGFAIEYQEPGGAQFYPLSNRLAFPGASGAVNPGILSSRLSPIQKFRWIHFPFHAGIPGAFTYRVTPVFMAANGSLSYGDAQTAAIGIRLHHKFVVIDFNKPTARVYTGSYNCSSSADTKNGENLFCIMDQRVATSYMIEGVTMFDHYEFRDAQTKAKTAGKPLELQKPPQAGSHVMPWWDEDWSNPQKKRDRELFGV